MAEYTEAVGRRKEASARVRLYPGTGEIVVNDKPVDEYFGRALDQMILRQPLVLTGTERDVQHQRPREGRRRRRARLLLCAWASPVPWRQRPEPAAACSRQPAS